MTRANVRLPSTWPGLERAKPRPLQALAFAPAEMMDRLGLGARPPGRGASQPSQPIALAPTVPPRQFYRRKQKFNTLHIQPTTSHHTSPFNLSDFRPASPPSGGAGRDFRQARRRAATWDRRGRKQAGKGRE